MPTPHDRAPQRSSTPGSRDGDPPADGADGVREGPDSGLTTTSRARTDARNHGATRLPSPPSGTPASAATRSASATRGRAATTTAGPPPTSATTSVTAVPSPSPLSAHSASMPMAGTALMSLASMASRYGSGAPTPDIGRSHTPPDLIGGALSGPVAWDSGFESGYASDNFDRSGRGTAIGDLNAELERLLTDSVDDTARGRAAMDAIIAEVDSALTALGPVRDTAAGRRQVMSTLGEALGRAESVLGRGHSSAVLTSERIGALAAHYARHPRPAAAGRRAGSGVSGPPRAMPAGRQGQWINEALRILARNGYDISQIDPGAIATIIAHESSGNPHAINLWDSNAAAGHPSKGIMQTIDSTFNAHALPGHRDIWNPVDNIIAGVRYSIDRYGSVGNVPGVANLSSGQGYVGY